MCRKASGRDMETWRQRFTPYNWLWTEQCKQVSSKSRYPMMCIVGHTEHASAQQTTITQRLFIKGVVAISFFASSLTRQYILYKSGLLPGIYATASPAAPKATATTTTKHIIANIHLDEGRRTVWNIRDTALYKRCTVYAATSAGRVIFNESARHLWLVDISISVSGCARVLLMLLSEMWLTLANMR